MRIEDIAGAGKIGAEVVKQTGEIAKEPFSNLTNPATKTIGQRIGDVFDLIFTPVEMAKIYKDHAISKFKDRLAEKIAAIPEEKRVTPSINIIGPALEASKYYIEDEELRNMFAELIASAMNSDTNHMTHPSYVEIIKQLSPLDAINLAFFIEHWFAIMVDYIMLNSNWGGDTDGNVVLSNVSLDLSVCKDINAMSNSLTNLQRLGLLEKMDVCLNSGSQEAVSTVRDIEKSGEYMTADILCQVHDFKHLLKEGLTDNALKWIDVRYWQLQPTSYGKNFISVCIKSGEVNP